MNLGTIWAELGLKLDKFEKGLSNASNRLEGAGRKMSQIGTGLSTKVTLPLVGLGAAAFAAANTVEEAMNTIRAGTGATGEDLEALGDDFKAVFARVPENAQQVSTAIADLNTRLGLTGEPLQKLTEQMLGLADLTGAQVGPLVASTTRMFGDWSVATDKQSESLDLLWKVSQSTGIQVERLADSLVAYGAPLRQMGFTLEESAVLMGKWEKEGVNMELVLGSLRMAMGHFADAGIPMRQGLDETMAKIKELGPGAEATSLAMEVFGARAGPDMAAAILEGRFAIDELMKAVQGSTETIAAADAETETFAEKMAMLRNQATLALEPLGVRLMDALMKLLPHITNLLERITKLAEGFANLSPTTQTVILTLVGLVAALGPVVTIVGKTITVIGDLGKAFVKIKAFLLGTTTKVGALAVAGKALKAVFLILTGPIGLIIAAVAALAAGVVLLIRNWDRIVPFFERLWESVKNIFAVVWEWIKDIFMRYHPIVLVIKHWQAIAGFFTNLWNTVRMTFANAWQAIVLSLTSARDNVFAIAQGIWDGIVGRFSSMVISIQNVLSGVVEIITSPFRRAREIVNNITKSIGDFLNRINPLARQSPSLVDNVRAGVRAIQEEYSKLERMKLPQIGVATPQGAAFETPGDRTAAYHGPLVVVQSMTVRSDTDIENISRQLYRYIRRI